jgi:hypothetical protein
LNYLSDIGWTDERIAKIKKNDETFKAALGELYTLKDNAGKVEEISA